MSLEKRETESCEDRERRKRHRTARKADAERNEADAELPAPHGQTAERGILSQSNIQRGSRFDGQYDVTGSLHQGNVINIQQTANRCINDLRVTDPRDDKKRIQDIKGGLLSDCYIWVLDNPVFRQWRDNEDQRLLWVNGDPGKGKTMLLCGIIDQLERTDAEGWSLSYFFCQATDKQISNATAVLRGLIFLLLDQDASLISYIKKKYDVAGKALFKGDNAWYALSAIFTNMLHDTKLQGVYLVVDALDECEEGLPQLLKLIVETSQKVPVKWLVSSRNSSQIREEMYNVARELSLEVNAKSVAAAVDSYIMHKVSQLVQRKGYGDKIAEQVRQHLLSNAESTFLWVASVCQKLGEGRRGNVLQKLKSFPLGLSALYEHMMQQLRASEDADLCKQVLALLATTYRPPSLAESTSFIEEGGSTVEDTESVVEIVGLCSSFLTIREETIYFVHQSAKDFLMKEASDIVFPEQQAAVHGQIFFKSVEAMSQTLKRDIYGLDSLGFAIEDVPRQRPNPDPLATIAYSCVYWIDHLIDASKVLDRAGSSPHDEAVARFLQGKGLYWIESLSLLRSMSEGMLAMERLLRHLQERLGASMLQALVKDAFRVLQTFRPAIESRPLQAYASALVLSPKNSLMRRLFVHERPQWLKCKTELAEQWSACEVTLEGHTDAVWSAAFSPDGRRVVSASHDKTIKLWDAQTGVCERTLEGHTAAVVSAAFLPDGRRVVSASDDKTVKLWDTQKGVCEATLKANISSVMSAAFSPNGRHIVLASGDETVKLWDLQTGVYVAMLEGHSFWVSSVAFSSDGQHIISASGDETVKQWDLQTGACEATLEGHSGAVRSAAFSRDGRRVVSASDDETVKLWDIQTGVCKARLEGHTGEVRSAAFSPNGHYIVSVSNDKAVKLWDTQTGSCEMTLKGHTDAVWSAAFSPDGQRVVSASYDETVKIWDLQTSACERTLKGHTDAVWSAAFSPNEQYIVSASNDKTVKLWDTQTSVSKATFEGHMSSVMSAAFSPDGRHIVSTSYDETVKIWDLQTGACERTLKGHTDVVWSAAFSPNGHYIVSASNDKTIKLWDTQTGSCEMTLNVGFTSSVSFDSTGTYVCTDRHMIRLGNTMPRHQNTPARRASLTYTPDYGFSPDGSWFQRQSQPVLWLPSEYRPSCSAVTAVDGGTALAVGCSSGRVYVYNFLAQCETFG